MISVITRKSNTLRAAALLVVWLVPAVAWAEWGTENWGEMIWGGGVFPVPSLSAWAQIVLGVLLLALPGALLLKRRSGARS